MKENKVWQTREWTGGLDRYSTSKECLYIVSWNKTICYDPMNHKTHPCEKGLCPLYYKRESENINKN